MKVNKLFKSVISLSLCLFMCLTLLPDYALAEDTGLDASEEIHSASSDNEMSEAADAAVNEACCACYSWDEAAEEQPLNNEELETYYAEKILFEPELISTYALHDTTQLTEDGWKLYNAVYSFISGIAQNGGSSVLHLDLNSAPFLSDYIGTTGQREFWDTMQTVRRKLRAEYPELLYWSEKALCGYDGFIWWNSDGALFKAEISFRVDPKYNGNSEDYYVYASKIQRALKAKNNAAYFAQEIINSGSSDWNKIYACANKIKALTDYNYSALDPNSSSEFNNDPWSIVNVFACDGGENKVVCEGFAKSFQYLFDMVFAVGEPECYCVTGNHHMWNLVTYQNENYFVDLTAYDKGWDAVMIAPKNGKVKTVEPGKVYHLIELNETRAYDEVTLAAFGPDVLTLAENNSRKNTGIEVSSKAVKLKTTGSNTSSTVDITLKGDLPASYRIDARWSNGTVADFEFGEYSFRQLPLTLYAKAKGSDTLTLTMIDNSTDAELCLCKIGVTVELGGRWRHDSNGYWYQYGSGDYARGFEKIDGKQYYFYNSGYMATGWAKIGGRWYYFGSSGEMRTGWQSLSGSRYYFKPDGKMVSGWTNIDNNWFYFTGGGAMCSGWKQLDGRWYYFSTMDDNPDFPIGAMLTGHWDLGGSSYYFGPEGGDNGYMRTGWIREGEHWYCYSSDGIMYKGWKQLDGRWYYFSKWADNLKCPRGSMLTGYWNLGSDSYYFGPEGGDNGYMRTGWQRINNEWYYFKSSGAGLKNDWLHEGQTWYYFDSSGKMVTGSVKINGRTEHFASDGRWIA